MFEGLRASWARHRVPWLVIFLLAAGLRAAVWHDVAQLPTAQALIEDARKYDADARVLIANGGVPEDVFYQAPAYPYFLASIYALGGSYQAVRAVQLLLGLLTVLLLAAITADLAGSRAALVAAVLAAGFLPLLFYGPLLLKPTLLLFLETAFLGALLRAARDVSAPAWSWLAAGWLLGLCVLLRGNLLLLVPAVLAWLWLRRAPGRVRGTGWLAAGLVVALAPVTWLNHKVSGEWVLTSSQSGSNFYIGNRAGAPGYYVPLFPGRQSPAHERLDAERYAAGIIERETGTRPERVSGPQMSSAFWREAGRDIRRAPGAWLRLMGRKFLYFWNDYEIPDAEDLAVYRGKSFVLARNPVGFGLVAGLGLAGLWFRRREPAWRPLVWLAAGSCVSVVLFYVFGRYRLPVAPFLLPAAAAAAMRLAVLPRKLGALVKGGGALTLVLLVFTYLPVVPAAERARLSIGPRVNLGVAGLRLAQEQMGGFEERGPEALLEAVATTATAIADLERAAAIDPTYLPATVHLGLGRSRLAGYVLRGGDAEAAVRLYDEAEGTLRDALAGPGREDHPELFRDAQALLVTIGTNRCRAREGAAARRLAASEPEGALEWLDAAAAPACTVNAPFHYLRAVALRELAQRLGRRALLEEALASVARATEAPGAAQEWRDLQARIEVELEAGEGE